MKGVSALVFAICALITYVESAKYKATVVEYRSIPDEANTVLRNVQNYVDLIEKTSSDIIVFPEYGLTTLDIFEKPNWKNDYALYVPNSYKEITLCEETGHVEKALKDISCVAKRKRVYVSINLIEKDNSTKDELFYNTNLVFDRAGKIAAKYRKINLYEEKHLTSGNDTVTFTSDMGVTFGVMTCSDIMFKHPATDMLTANVNDVIYPTAWSSQTPFQMALSIQAGYAKKNNVNLLAANYNNPAGSNGGSGIYSSSGVSAKTYISGLAKTVVIDQIDIDSAPVTITCESPRRSAKPDVGGRDVGELPTLNDFVTVGTSVAGYKSKFKTLSTENIEITDELCQGDICCNFQATVVNKLTSENGHYRWAVYLKDGVTSCALVFCKTSEDSSCGERFNEDTKATFTKITVKGKFPKSQYTMPITSRVNLRPIYSYSYCAKSAGVDHEDISMEIYEDLHRDITAFGIVGYQAASSGAIWANTIVVGALAVFAIVKNYI